MSQSVVVRPLGPFSLAAAKDFASHWEPVSSDARRDEPLVLGFRTDGSHEAAAAALTQAPNGAVTILVGGTDDPSAAAQAQRIVSLDVDASTYPAVGEREPAIGRLMAELPGLRPVLFASPYEAACWAVLSQRISLRQAASLQSQLTAALGDVVEVGGREQAVFPHPRQLVDAQELPRVPSVKADRLRGIGRAAMDGELDIDGLRDLDAQTAVTRLQRLPGIGPFWASLIYLRATGVRDVFPDEPMSIAALASLYGLGAEPSPAAVQAVTDSFAPWRTWVSVLLRVAASRGHVPVPPSHPRAAGSR